MHEGVVKLLIAVASVALFMLLHHLAGMLIAAVSVTAIVQVFLALYTLNVVMKVIARMVAQEVARSRQ